MEIRTLTAKKSRTFVIGRVEILNRNVVKEPEKFWPRFGLLDDAASLEGLCHRLDEDRPRLRSPGNLQDFDGLSGDETSPLSEISDFDGGHFQETASVGLERVVIVRLGAVEEPLGGAENEAALAADLTVQGNGTSGDDPNLFEALRPHAV